MIVTHKMEANLLDGWAPQVLRMVQNDANTRAIELNLYQGEEAWEVPSDATAALGFCKPDKTKGLYDQLPDGTSAVTISGNKVTVIVAPQVLTVAGEVHCLIVLRQGESNQLASFPFVIRAKENPSAGEVLSNDYYKYTTLEDINRAVEEILESASYSTGVAEQAAQTASQAAADAEQAVEDAAATIQNAENAASEATEAAERANAASSVAYEAKELAENAQEDVNTLREVVSKFHSNIVEEAEGEFITVSDASDLELAGLNLYGKTTQFTTTGKNLLKNTATTQTINGVTFTVNDDGSVTANGTATSAFAYVLNEKIELVQNARYSLTGCPSGGSGGTYEFSVINPDGWVGHVAEYGAGSSFTCTQAQYRAQISVRAGATLSNLTFYPMIRLAGATDATYEPYTGGIPSPNPDYPQALESIGDSGSVTVTACGKNLLPNINTGSDPVTSGDVMFTTNADGSVTVNGTAGGDTAYAYIVKSMTLPAGSYILSGSSGGSDTMYFLGLYDYTHSAIINNFSDPKQFSLSESSEIEVAIYVRSGVVMNNVVFWPMIRLASVTDDTYEPYLATTATVSTPNGLPGIPVESGGNYTDPATGKQWICDEVDFEKGVYVQRVGKVDNSGWYNSALNGEGERYSVALQDLERKAFTPVICSSYPTKKVDSYGTPGDYISSNEALAYGKLNIRCKEKTFGGVEAFKAWADENKLETLYILAEEQTIPLTDIDPDALTAYAAMHTNYPNTTVFNDAGAHMGLSYVADTKLYVDKQFNKLAAQLVNNV